MWRNLAFPWCVRVRSEGHAARGVVIPSMLVAETWEEVEDLGARLTAPETQAAAAITKCLKRTARPAAAAGAGHVWQPDIDSPRAGPDVRPAQPLAILKSPLKQMVARKRA